MKVYIGSHHHKKIMAFEIDESKAKEFASIRMYGGQYQPAAIKSLLIKNSEIGEPIFKKLVKCICCGEVECNCLYPHDIIVTFDLNTYKDLQEVH